jgi:hypothetical protein
MDIAALTHNAALVVVLPFATAAWLRVVTGRAAVTAGPLSAGEWERVRMYPYLTERMLHQSAALAPLGEIAVQHRASSRAVAAMFAVQHGLLPEETVANSRLPAG